MRKKKTAKKTARPKRPPANPPEAAVDKIVLLMAAGSNEATIRQRVAEGKLEIPASLLDAGLAEAKQRITLAADYHRDRELGESITRLKDVYKTARAMVDLRVALQAQRELNRILRLDRPADGSEAPEGPEPAPGEPGPSKAGRPWIVDSLAQVAEFFARSIDTIKGEWRANGMPGSARRWDLAQILAWRDERQQKTAAVRATDQGVVEAERRRAVAEANRAERRDRREAGDLVEVEEVRRLFAQHVNAARSILEQIPDRVIAALPQGTRAAARRRTQSQARRIVADCCDTLADLLTQYQPEA